MSETDCTKKSQVEVIKKWRQGYVGEDLFEWY